jgi:hypothetical protein
MYKSAKSLEELLLSTRAKAFEDVANLLRSDAVPKGDYDFPQMDIDDLIKLINGIDKKD